jgi:uncharacterized membrane protein YphA (DoxX/SURF4 family)
MKNDMMMKWGDRDMGLFIIRLGIAIVFIVNGWMKFSAMEQTVANFATMGISAFWVYVLAAVELLGGIGMLLGYCVKWAGILLSLVMVFAIFLVTGKMGFLAYQINIILLSASLGISMTGAGSWAVGKK